MAGGDEPVDDAAPSRLARRLSLGDAVVIGLGSMIGAGVFATVGPAAEAAGSGLLIDLVIAAAVAYCNATSSAELAAVYPASGGTYVYGRERLGPFWGYLAGWGFLVGKTASCAAMALTVGAYAAPAWQRPMPRHVDQGGAHGHNRHPPAHPAAEHQRGRRHPRRRRPPRPPPRPRTAHPLTYLKWGHLLRFDPNEVAAWIDECRRHPGRPHVQ